MDLFGEEVRPKAKYVQRQDGKDDYDAFKEKKEEDGDDL